jgi:hypothetical protein
MLVGLIYSVPLATEPSIENTATKFEKEYVRCVRNEEECVCSVSAVRLIVTTRSSGPPSSGKIIKEMPGSVASGTSYIIQIYLKPLPNS